MERGIVCKVWNIHGDTESKRASAQMNDSVSYILNEEKTDITLSNLNTHTQDQLGRECKYIENDLKTLSGALVGVRNLKSSDVKEAVREMMEVKKFYEKTDGRAALHGTISLCEEESDVRNAGKLLKLCNCVMREVFPNNQAIFAVHTNTENMHIHFIVNSVGLDGKKIHQPADFIEKVLQPCINKYARENGFTPNAKWDKSRVEKNLLVNNKIYLRKCIDRAVEESDSIEEFIHFLQEEGLVVNVGKHISLKTDQMGKAMRTHNLGPNYTKDAIVERIATKKNAMELSAVGQYAIEKKQNDVVITSMVKMKRYKQMTNDERAKVIHQLKLGKNPWRDHAAFNWQINRIAYEINQDKRIEEYIDFYSPDGSVQAALEKIIEIKKQLSQEKKLIKNQKRKYKPIIDIYEEMKEIEKKAYLYEYCHDNSYRIEFEKYRELTNRLKKNYNKEIEEVANFMEECDERIMYATAQMKELSEEYKELKSYASKNKIKIKNADLMDTIGYAEGKQNEKILFFEASTRFIATDNKDVMLQVTKVPAKDSKGNDIQGYEISVISKDGEILEKIDNCSGDRNFRNTVKDLEKKYSLRNPVSYENSSLAFEHLKTKSKVSAPPVGGDLQINEKGNEPAYNFTTAINLGSIGAINDNYVIGNKSNGMFLAVIRTTEEEITMTVLDRQGEFQDQYTIPGIKNKDGSGFQTISRMQRKYGFSDDLYIYESLEDAKLQKQATIRMFGNSL